MMEECHSNGRIPVSATSVVIDDWYLGGGESHDAKGATMKYLFNPGERNDSSRR